MLCQSIGLVLEQIVVLAQEVNWQIVVLEKNVTTDAADGEGPTRAR